MTSQKQTKIICNKTTSASVANYSLPLTTGTHIHMNNLHGHHYGISNIKKNIYFFLNSNNTKLRKKRNHWILQKLRALEVIKQCVRMWSPIEFNTIAGIASSLNIRK